MVFGLGQRSSGGREQRRITPARTSEFIPLIGGLPIAIDEQTPNRALSTALDLARSDRLSAYDASYLELAMRLVLAELFQIGDRLGSAANW